MPQAIEWALAHLDEETKDPASKYGAYGSVGGQASSPGDDKGLVVELPDGKLFKLKNPSGRVVEMPNSAVVEMLDGQVVEMSNGQQLEMVDGSLVEIVPAAIQLDDGDVIGHKILDFEASRKAAAKAQSMNSASQAGVSASLSDASGGGGGGGGGYLSGERQRAEQQEAQMRNYQMQERDIANKQQLAAQQEGLKAQEDAVLRHRRALQQEQDGVSKQAAMLKKREAEIQLRESKLERMQAELNRLSEQLKVQEKDIKDREGALQLTLQSRGSTIEGVNGADVQEGDERSPLESIDAGRIRFSELTMGNVLGSGSFADVYRAEWRMPCAVKKMKGRISKEQMTEFVREGEMMRSLKHPGIVKLLGVCVEGGSFYLVQEIVNGFGNLFDFLHKKNARLTYWQCVQIACGITDAMGYLHERQIVHRDLKPQNCLLVNEKGEVKLCDFGLARLKNAAFVETVSNTAGTPAYQAPEMLRDEPISEKVDLYGFGIMLWEMYTGKLPWSDKNYHQMIHTVAVRNERPPITPDMPRELVTVIEACWHPIPAKRPTFSELKQTFKELARIIPQDVPKSQQQPAVQHQQHQQQQQQVPSRSVVQQPSAQQQGHRYVQQQGQGGSRPVPQGYQGQGQSQPVVYGGYQQGW